MAISGAFRVHLFKHEGNVSIFTQSTEVPSAKKPLVDKNVGVPPRMVLDDKYLR